MEHDILVALCERALRIHVEERGGSIIMSSGDLSEYVYVVVTGSVGLYTLEDDDTVQDVVSRT